MVVTSMFKIFMAYQQNAIHTPAVLGLFSNTAFFVHIVRLLSFPEVCSSSVVSVEYC